MSRSRSGAASGCSTLLCVAVCLPLLTLPSCRRDSPAASEPPASPAAARFTGTWTRDGAAFDLRMDDERLWVRFRGEHEYMSDAGPMVNVGEADGWATVDGDTAVFRPAGREAECTITMMADAETLDVREQGECGFGLNVTAAGTYRRK